MIKSYLRIINFNVQIYNLTDLIEANKTPAAEKPDKLDSKQEMLAGSSYDKEKKGESKEEKVKGEPDEEKDGRESDREFWSIKSNQMDKYWRRR